MFSWFLSLTSTLQLTISFLFGVVLGVFLMNLLVIVKNKKINAYQRQLEKESINSDNSSARVRVLEQKIEVLEKALENALKEWILVKS